jgi:hypothetical protein
MEFGGDANGGIRPMAAKMKGGNKMYKGGHSTSNGGAEEEDESDVEEMEDDVKLDFMTDILKNTREYSHLKKVSRKGSKHHHMERVDFTQTIYFATALEVKNGRVSGEADLSDLITQFRVSVSGFTAAGVYGFNTKHFTSTKQFYTMISPPKSMRASDNLLIPLAITNHFNEQVKLDVIVETTNGIEAIATHKRIEIGASSTGATDIGIKAIDLTENARLTVTVKDINSRFQDSTVNRISVYQRGTPVTLHNGGFMTLTNSTNPIPTPYHLNSTDP